ncbi:SAM-dependent methyltransferase [Kineosporia sp. R_H_3]|uniref:class I SAM-dependent methyltransferase n=1 Tax=Kineosporia sp. R_H_3 TaxID=1961848 RepID=UPI000B4B2963|nr:SAM-dependent methyltransferase [Kineosporia sp. R_H_3]
MPEDLTTALAALRPLLLDTGTLVRGLAAGRRRGAEPAFARAELRPVDLKAGRRLQVVTTDGRTPATHNHAPGPDAESAVDALLAEPFGNWHVETTDQVVQLRVTKKGEAQVHTSRTSRRDVEPSSSPALRSHDRPKERLLDPADPLFGALGAEADKRRQVDAFLRLLAPVVGRAVARAREAGRPLHVVDLGCGNAYLTFAAHRWLAAHPDVAEVGVRTVGVDVRDDMVARNTRLATDLGMAGLSFVTGTIADARVEDDVDVVLALHACDTATDEALARAVRWAAPVVLAAPCCHHDVQRQVTAAQADGVLPPHPYTALTRHGILRERFADVLTDAVRADLLRLLGYRVDVVEFVDSRHTPRNALVRAERTGARPDDARRREYLDLVGAWHLEPALATMLADEVARALGDAA